MHIAMDDQAGINKMCVFVDLRNVGGHCLDKTALGTMLELMQNYFPERLVSPLTECECLVTFLGFLLHSFHVHFRLCAPRNLMPSDTHDCVFLVRLCCFCLLTLSRARQFFGNRPLFSGWRGSLSITLSQRRPGGECALPTSRRMSLNLWILTLFRRSLGAPPVMIYSRPSKTPKTLL